MANLITRHDKLHVHAILGSAALLHFLVRFFTLFVYGEDSFRPGLVSAGTLSIHVFLHATSFQFDLPSKRLWTKPMIWKEFRAHNAVFALRNIVCAALGIWLPGWWYRNPTISSLVCKVLGLSLTCFAADKVTERLGDTEKRTTNAMPYPLETERTVESTAKLFYAKSQFAATSLAALSTPMLSFGSVLAMEIASFLMTLVRKGKILAWQYHAVYAVALFAMCPAMVATLHSGDEEAAVATFRAMCTCFVACELRLHLRWSKYVAWAIAVFVGYATGSGVALLVDVRWVAWPGMLWSSADTLRGFYTAAYCEGSAHPGKDVQGQASTSSEAVGNSRAHGG